MNLLRNPIIRFIQTHDEFLISATKKKKKKKNKKKNNGNLSAKKGQFNWERSHKRVVWEKRVPRRVNANP